jgi:hypothetical protein
MSVLEESIEEEAARSAELQSACGPPTHRLPGVGKLTFPFFFP